MTTRADLQQLYDECTRSDPGRVCGSRIRDEKGRLASKGGDAQ